MRPELKHVIRFILVVAAIVASFEAGRASSPRGNSPPRSDPVSAAVTLTAADARPPWASGGFRDDAGCQMSGHIPECN
ncbi:MAG TPA: hypothetical protein VF805_13455 [Anaeromyxobacteraceae bacterium]